MSLVARKLPVHLTLSFASSRRRNFPLRHIAALQQCNFGSTCTTAQKPLQLANLRFHKSSKSSSGFSCGIKKQNEALASVWPRPEVIPYEDKFVNHVNLIGYVAIPVRFEADSNGKHFSATTISVGNGGEKKSLSIPVVFEGELAHVVACHVKENHCVFISGQLSVESMGLNLGGSIGKFHVVVENFCFVQVFENNPGGEKLGFSSEFGEVEKPSKQGHDKDEVNREICGTQQITKEENVNLSENRDSRESLMGQTLNGESYSESQSLMMLQGGKHERRKGKSASKKKERGEILQMWRDLVKNPMQWWDYRGHKMNGLVKENFPDFKRKGTGESLWVKSAPEFVLPGLGKLECDVKDLNSKQVQGGEWSGERTKKGKNDDSWRHLAENPDKWWDNRMNKRNPRAPDFKHKETGEALWLDNSPVCIWALSIKDGRNTEHSDVLKVQKTVRK